MMNNKDNPCLNPEIHSEEEIWLKIMSNLTPKKMSFIMEVAKMSPRHSK